MTTITTTTTDLPLPVPLLQLLLLLLQLQQLIQCTALLLLLIPLLLGLFNQPTFLISNFLWARILAVTQPIVSKQKYNKNQCNRRQIVSCKTIYIHTQKTHFNSLPGLSEFVSSPMKALKHYVSSATQVLDLTDWLTAWLNNYYKHNNYHNGHYDGDHYLQSSRESSAYSWLHWTASLLQQRHCLILPLCYTAEESDRAPEPAVHHWLCLAATS